MNDEVRRAGVARDAGETARFEIADAESHQARQRFIFHDRINGHARISRVVNEMIELERAALIDAVGEYDEGVASRHLLQFE